MKSVGKRKREDSEDLSAKNGVKHISKKAKNTRVDSKPKTHNSKKSSKANGGAAKQKKVLVESNIALLSILDSVASEQEQQIERKLEKEKSKTKWIQQQQQKRNQIKQVKQQKRIQLVKKVRNSKKSESLQLHGIQKIKNSDSPIKHVSFSPDVKHQ